MGWFPPRYARWLGWRCASSQGGSCTSQSAINKATKGLGKGTRARKIGSTGETSPYRSLISVGESLPQPPVLLQSAIDSIHEAKLESVAPVCDLAGRHGRRIHK